MTFNQFRLLFEDEFGKTGRFSSTARMYQDTPTPKPKHSLKITSPTLFIKPEDLCTGCGVTSLFTAPKVYNYLSRKFKVHILGCSACWLNDTMGKDDKVFALSQEESTKTLKIFRYEA